MTYGARLNIGLAVALGAMLLVAWLMQRDTGPERPMLADIDFAQVSSIDVALRGREPLAFERDGAGWHMRAPLDLEVEARRLEEIVNGLNVTSLSRHPATALDLDEVGLGGEPVARVTVDGAAYALGEATALGDGRYVMRNEVVHVVRDVLHFRLGGQPHSWARRQPLPPGARIARIEVGGSTVRRADPGWALEPDDETVSADALQRFVDAWARAQAFQVNRAPVPSDGFDEVAEVWLDGRDEPLAFGLRRTDSAMVLVREDLELEYRLPLQDSERLSVLERDD